MKRTEILETFDGKGRLIERLVQTEIVYDDGSRDTECHGHCHGVCREEE